MCIEGSGIHVDNESSSTSIARLTVSGIFAAVMSPTRSPCVRPRMLVEHWQNAVKQGAAAARNMTRPAFRVRRHPLVWSDQYDANLQYAGFHTTWQQLVVRGSIDSGSYLACYINDGRIDAAVGLNRVKDVRRVMPLIKSRRR